MQKNNEPLPFNKFCSNPPRSTFACVCVLRGKAGTETAVIVNWIKIKKQIYSKELKKQTTDRGSEHVAVGERGVTVE